MAPITNTDLIRRLLETTSKHEERFANHDGQLKTQRVELDQLWDQLQTHQDQRSKNSEEAVRFDERLKQIESRLERRWNLMLAIASGSGGVILTLLLQRLLLN